MKTGLKKTASIFLVFVLIFSLTSCNFGNGKTEKQNPDKKATAAKPEEERTTGTESEYVSEKDGEEDPSEEKSEDVTTGKNDKSENEAEGSKKQTSGNAGSSGISGVSGGSAGSGNPDGTGSKSGSGKTDNNGTGSTGNTGGVKYSRERPGYEGQDVVCGYCGWWASVTYNACPNCGKAWVADSEHWVCSHCGSFNRRSDKYCVKCLYTQQGTSPLPSESEVWAFVNSQIIPKAKAAGFTYNTSVNRDNSSWSGGPSVRIPEDLNSQTANKVIEDLQYRLSISGMTSTDPNAVRIPCYKESTGEYEGAWVGCFNIGVVFDPFGYVSVGGIPYWEITAYFSWEWVSA